VLQRLAEPVKAMDGQMPNLPRKAGILPGSPAFCALPGEKNPRPLLTTFRCYKVPAFEKSAAEV
jgi:hypothetical protein